MSEPASSAPWWAHAYEALALALATALVAIARRWPRQKKEPAPVKHSNTESGELRRLLDEDRMRDIANTAAFEMARDLGERMDRQDERMDKQDEHTLEIRRDLGKVREGLGEIRGGFESMVDTVRRVETVIDRTLGPRPQ